MNKMVPLSTFAAMALLAENFRTEDFLPDYRIVQPALYLWTFVGLLAMNDKRIQRKKFITTIELIQHPENERYSSEAKISI